MSARKKRSGNVLWISVLMGSFVLVIGLLMGHYLFNHDEVLTLPVKTTTAQENKDTASKVARPSGPVTVHTKINVSAN